MSERDPRDIAIERAARALLDALDEGRPMGWGVHKDTLRSVLAMPKTGYREAYNRLFLDKDAVGAVEVLPRPATGTLERCGTCGGYLVMGQSGNCPVCGEART